MRLFALLLTFALSACATEAQRIDRIAAAKCPNGVNDTDAYRDANGRLHVEVGCD